MKLEHLSEAIDKVEWAAERGSSTFTFEYPPKKNSLTAKFVDFVKKNPGTTKKEFYASIDRELTPGNNTSFFAAIKDAGIVSLSGTKYSIGPNYGAWTKGKLENSDLKGRQARTKKWKTDQDAHPQGIVDAIRDYAKKHDLDVNGWEFETHLNRAIKRLK